MRADSTEPKLNVTPLMGAQSSTDSELSRSVPPLMRPTTKPMSGVMRPDTMPLTMAVNALPMTTPDRQVEHVAAHDELFELVQKFLHV